MLGSVLTCDRHQWTYSFGSHCPECLREEEQMQATSSPHVPCVPPRPQWSLLPASATKRVVELLTWTASAKYQDEQGREKSLDEQYDSLMRHLSSWRLGERLDNESRMETLAHVAARALFMLEIELKKETE